MHEFVDHIKLGWFWSHRCYINFCSRIWAFLPNFCLNIYDFIQIGYVLSTGQVKLDGNRDSGNCDENRYTSVRLISLLVVVLLVSIFSYLDGTKNMFFINIFYFKGKEVNTRSTLKKYVKKIVSSVVH